MFFCLSRECTQIETNNNNMTSNIDAMLKCQNARCMCSHDLDDEDTNEINRTKARTKNELMNNYDAFDAFVMEMLPQDRVITQDPITHRISIFQEYPDRLCEDVIGEISRFLVV